MTPAPADSSLAPVRAPRLDVVTDLLGEVERAAFPLDIAGAPELRALREQLLTQLRARLLPRLAGGTVPAVVVLGGSSGAGKSSLLNALLGDEVSEAGVLRPTTRQAVVAVHPDGADVVRSGPLADLARVVVHPAVPAGLALLDAPDLDSVHAANRSLATRLLEVADLWVFTTTASRYGDAAAWHLLTAAQERGITTAVVLNRAPARVLGQVRRDLLGRMEGLGLGGAPLFVVPDAGPLEGPLPDGLAAELAAWLRLVASRHQSENLVRRTTRGVWAALREQLLDLAAGMDDQAEAAEVLREAAQRAAEGPAADVGRTLREGRAGAGAPTTHWLALASTGGPLAPLVTDGARLRPGLRRGAVTARSRAAAGLGEEVAAALTVVIADALHAVPAAARRAWEPVELGARALLRDIEDRGDRADRRAAGVVEDWRAIVGADVTGRAPAGALDDAGLAGLVQAGAAGVSGATSAASALGAADAVARARDALVAAAAAAVHESVRPYLDAVAGLGTAPGTGLRLRAGELKEHG